MPTHPNSPESHLAAVRRYRETHQAEGLCIECARDAAIADKGKTSERRYAEPNRVRCTYHLEKRRICAERFRIRQRLAEGRGKLKPGPKSGGWESVSKASRARKARIKAKKQKPRPRLLQKSRAG